MKSQPVHNTMNKDFPVVENKYISITNIKFSLKITNSWCLEKLFDYCFSFIQNHVRLLGSKLVIRIPNQSMRIIVFPKRKGCEFQHVNITGVKTFNEIENSLKYVQLFLNRKKEELQNLIIDNIWAKSDILLHDMKKETVTSLNLR